MFDLNLFKNLSKNRSLLSLKFAKDGKLYNFSKIDGDSYSSDGILVTFDLNQQTGEFALTCNSTFPTRVEVSLNLNGEDAFHFIPCNIYGNNNFELVDTPSYPHLTDVYKDKFTSPKWSFRADRAAYPVSIVVSNNIIAGIEIDPYSQNNVPSGLFSKLRCICGASLGYINFPVTFENKDLTSLSVNEDVLNDKIYGKLHFISGEKRQISQILKEIYYKRRKRAPNNYTIDEYIDGFVDFSLTNAFDKKTLMFADLNYIPKSGKCFKWRDAYEIGWTGGVQLGYPFLKARLEKNNLDSCFDSLVKLNDTVCNRYNDKSGFLYDLIETSNLVNAYGQVFGDVNGWWGGYIVKNVHCAYTGGTAVFYLLKSFQLLNNYEIKKDNWLDISLKVLDNVINLQRDDGNLGYSYFTDKKKVASWDGFAGCWYAAALCKAYEITNNDKYLQSAKAALDYYYGFVKDFNCYGTPMDTRWSCDQEGCLSFIRAAKTLHKLTKDNKYLEMLIDAINYEFTWRYSYNTKPVVPPLNNENFYSCGGSVTSVSNPHIHPMGAYIYEDLFYAFEITGDTYFKERADDCVFMFNNCSQIFTNVLGATGINGITERWCPSDGLLIQKYPDGSKSSIWFAHNAWSMSAVLEGLLQYRTLNK